MNRLEMLQQAKTFLTVDLKQAKDQLKK